MNEDLIEIDSDDITVLKFDQIQRFACSKTELEILLMLKDSKNKSFIINNLDIKTGQFNSAVLKMSEKGVLEVDKADLFDEEKNNKKSDASQDKQNIINEALNYLVARFSEAIGPIAEVVAEDEIYEMGETRSDFPAERFAELINLLSSQIPRTDKKQAFQKAMMLKLKELQ